MTRRPASAGSGKIAVMDTDDAGANQAALQRFIAACEAALAKGQFDRLVLASYQGPEADLKRVTVRAIELHGVPHLSFTYSHERRDLTCNMAQAQGLQALRGLIGTEFANAHLHTTLQALQLAYSRKGRASLR